MDALRDGVAAQLVGNRPHILSQIGEARTGFHFDYKLGKTVGSVTIAPLELTPMLSRIEPLPNAVVESALSVRLRSGVQSRISAIADYSSSDSE